MTETPNTITVNVCFPLIIDRAEWTRQFPDEVVSYFIARSAAEHAALVVSDLFLDQGWTRDRISNDALDACTKHAAESWHR